MKESEVSRAKLELLNELAEFVKHDTCEMDRIQLGIWIIEKVKEVIGAQL